jgi:hypothetical protein
MGKALLIWRLAVRDLRHRPVQTILLLVVIAAGATTLTVGLALHGTTNRPYASTRSATNGPDVVATILPGANGSGPATTAKPGGSAVVAISDSADARLLLPLENARGVATSSGPFPVTWTSLRDGHATGGAEVEGRTSDVSSVDQPKLLRGGWIRRCRRGRLRKRDRPARG